MNKRVDYGKKNRRHTHRQTQPASEKAAVARSNSGREREGASLSGISQGAIVQAWIAHHRQSCRDSLGRLFRTPWQSLLTWTVIAIAIVLPAALYLGLQNVQQITQGWQGKAEMSLFLHPKARPQAIDVLRERLMKEPSITHIAVISPEQAKLEFQQYAGLGNILDSLEDNPLPAVMVLTLDNTLQPHQLEQLQGQLQQERLVDVAQLDIAWLKRLNEMTRLARHIVTAFAVLLALGVLLVVGNTIRLEIENRREEIVVTKMVGGTDGFVRRPFLYTGLWYGVGGALIAFILLLLAEMWVAEPLNALFLLYESEYSLSWLSLNSVAFIFLLSSTLGLAGAWLAVARHLRHIEPV